MNDQYRDVLLMEYVMALALKETETIRMLERIFRVTTGMPAAREIESARRRLECAVAADDYPAHKAPAAPDDLPEAFAEFIEAELDFDRVPDEFCIGDPVLYLHTASGQWLPGAIAWVGKYDHDRGRYSVRTTFPNGKTRTVGGVPRSKIKPVE